MCVAAVVAFFLILCSDLAHLADLPATVRSAIDIGEDLKGWVALLVMGLLSEGLAIRVDLAGRKEGNSSVTFIPLLASVQLFGPTSAVVLMATTGGFGEFFVRRKERIRAVFNVAQWTVAASVGGLAFSALGGKAFVLSAPSGWEYVAHQLPPFIAFGLVFLFLNHVAVTVAIVLSQQLRFVDVLFDALVHSGASLQFLVAPIAIAVAFLYMQLKVTAIVVVFLPLLFVRNAYVTMAKLQRANRDLLTALVKAIETRDPYTSGHSLRVSHLARSIAEAMGVPRRAIEQIEQAALLHDLGKIEAVYTSILMKPAALSPEERGIIESHVTKGEELLRTLSSFPEEVISAVRHHHEREDGKGYPDGIKGNAIPLGAKIIAVCDAVDAMLSDRPYRSALSIPIVMQQLREHTGTQFDPAVVRALLASNLLVDYADMMRAWRRDDRKARSSLVTPISTAMPRKLAHPGGTPASGA